MYSKASSCRHGARSGLYPNKLLQPGIEGDRQVTEMTEDFFGVTDQHLLHVKSEVVIDRPTEDQFAEIDNVDGAENPRLLECQKVEGERSLLLKGNWSDGCRLKSSSQNAYHTT